MLIDWLQLKRVGDGIAIFGIQVVVYSPTPLKMFKTQKRGVEDAAPYISFNIIKYGMYINPYIFIRR